MKAKAKEKAERKKKEKKGAAVPPVPQKGKLITNPIDGSSDGSDVGKVYTDTPAEEDIPAPDDEFEEELPL